MCGLCCTFKKLHPKFLLKLGVDASKGNVIASLTNAWELTHIAMGKIQSDEDYIARKAAWDNDEIVYGEAIDINDMPDNYFEVLERIAVIDSASIYRIPVNFQLKS